MARFPRFARQHLTRRSVMAATMIGAIVLPAARASTPRYAEGVGSATYTVDSGSGWEVRQLNIISKTGTYLAYGTGSPFLSCVVSWGDGPDSASADIVYQQDIDWLGAGDQTPLSYTWNVHAYAYVSSISRETGDATTHTYHSLADPLSSQLTVSAHAPTNILATIEEDDEADSKHRSVTSDGPEYTDNTTIHAAASTTE
jgi:hypothetical protein